MGEKEKITTLMESIPFIQEFRGKTFVIKYGGSIIENEVSKKAFIEDVVLLKLMGINIIIVHGGGPDISKFLNKLNIKTKFINGLRETTDEMMSIVEMVLSGKINKELTSMLCSHGMSSIGISGKDGNLIVAKKKYVEFENKEIDLGCVGEVESINQKVLLDLLEKDYIPVISPVGCDLECNTYNINADYAAAAISASLQAEKLIFLTDVDGVYKDINDESSFISRIYVDDIKKYIKNGILTGGMIPKMECCIDAIEGGTESVHLISGVKEHSLLLEVFTRDGIGTMIENNDNWRVLAWEKKI